jgi:hypothetical protein
MDVKKTYGMVELIKFNFHIDKILMAILVPDS